MPLAGLDVIVIAVETQLAWAFRHVRGKRGDNGRLAGLAFLAAETATHAACLDAHKGVRQSQGTGDKVLHLGRILCRGMNMQRARLVGYRQSRLPFEIEMLLPADGEAAFEPMRRTGQRSADIATAEIIIGQDAAALRAAARSLINERLRGSADDVAALRTILGDAQDNSRRSLQKIFGKNEVNRLTRLVEREMEYRNTSKVLTPQRAEAQGAQAEEAYKNATGDVVSLDTAKQLAHGAINPVNIALRSIKGTQGPGFREGLSTFLTAPPEQFPAYMQGMRQSISADKAVRRAQKFAPLAEKPFTSSQGRPEDNRSTGGRTGRATGGAVNLMALAKAAKNHVTKVTEPLLNESDDTVAHALAVAGKNI
jgi:hypothetical protein